MPRPSISACILTFNSERTIAASLKSVRWVDEIVVVDSFSTDKTLEIVGQYTSNIHQRPWPGFREQFNFARHLASGQWILWLDSDEVLSLELRGEIHSVLSCDLSGIGGFSFPRRSYYLGRWIDHGGWYPDHVLRLVPREACWEGEEPHPKIRVNGQIKKLKGPVFHYTYRHITDQIQTIDRYSSFAAREMRASGRVFSLGAMLLHPPFRFIKEYLFKQGFRDGIPGLIIAMATAFYVFIKYAKVWEIQFQADGERSIEDCPGH